MTISEEELDRHSRRLIARLSAMLAALPEDSPHYFPLNDHLAVRHRSGASRRDRRIPEHRHGDAVHSHENGWILHSHSDVAALFPVSRPI